MRTLPPKSGSITPIDTNMAPVQPQVRAQTADVPLGPAPTVTQPRGFMPQLLAGLAKPAVAAVMMATLFSGPAIAQGAAIDTVKTATPVEVQDLQVRPALAEAYGRLLARNGEGGRSIDGKGWGNELEGIDSLARAVYDFADVNNPNGNYSFWGGQLRGVYSEGGLGVGFSMRPKLRGPLNVVTLDALKTGVRDLDRALDAPRLADQGSDDLDTLAARGLSPKALHGLTETLLETIVNLEEAKERATNKGTALITHDELLKALEPGSDLHALAQTVLQNKGWDSVLGREIKTINGRREAFGRGPMKNDSHVDEGVTHYVLLLGKRAQQENLLQQVRAHL